MGRRQPGSVALLLLLAACTSPPGAAPTSLVNSSATTTSTSVGSPPTTQADTTSTVGSVPPEFEYIGTVIESSEHGPEACAAVVLMSLPPQCSGIPLPNLDWETVPWAEEVRGTTWAEVVLIGQFDGHVLTLTEPPGPVPADHYSEPPAVDFTPPCDEPPGGWTDMRSEEVDHTSASMYAETQEEFAAQWMYRPNPQVDRVVLVFTFTDDLATHTLRLRELYDGALCVGSAPRSRAQLEQIRDELPTLLWSPEALERGIYPGLQEGYLLSTGRGLMSVSVIVVAALDEDAAQDWLDLLYGDGTVRIRTILTRVDS